MKIALCRLCGTRFRPRAGKLYCSEKCRLLAWKTTAAPCFYCGCPADTIDHVPPRCVRPLLVEHQIVRWKFVEVEACRECNTALGAFTIWTLSERKTFIKKWLRRRYAKFLAIPQWSEEEIAELGRNMAGVVKEGQIIAELARKRIAW